MKSVALGLSLVFLTVSAGHAAPNFENQTETIEAVGALSKACTNSGKDQQAIQPCIDQCATSKRLIQSQFSKSYPSAMGIRAAYEACEEAMKTATAADVETDLSTWTISGVTLGDDYNKLFETYDKSKAMIETHGYSQEHGVETSRRIWFYQEGAQDAPVDIIEYYKFQIRDGQVYVNGTADGEGKITELRFKQTADGSGAARLKVLTDRYGPPRKESGGSYFWGCESAREPCLEGEPTDWALTVTMRHHNALDAWKESYRAALSEAKGESSESKF